ncbi:MSHA biogenesis protein MshK [Oceanimonas sp. CHS3-5]|uniref:SctD/MshK family protein n=1 Tax=Oceanimonas sp. CHS3-5 TaxID=3068186 RepID=UPI00273F92A9|nr:MSHA biogenesis protein MshK [Oceanimonas sp. CHS3-5]MDP5291764.1 MSHA biogenesis protein MshK [Oceanimonas sp. CHS3-5]
MVNASALVFTLLSATSSLQDPTRPLAGLTPPAAGSTELHAQTPAEPRLQAIFGGGQPSAILDGHRYVQGDTIGGYRLLRITSERVVLEGQGKRLVLSLFPTFDNADTQ